MISLSPTQFTFTFRRSTYFLVFIFAFIPKFIWAAPRCWIGVIDQINPPWVNVSGEHQERLTLHIDQVYEGAQEGDWVIYWVTIQRLEELKSPRIPLEYHRLKMMRDHLAESDYTSDLNRVLMNGEIK